MKRNASIGMAYLYTMLVVTALCMAVIGCETEQSNKHGAKRIHTVEMVPLYKTR